MQMPLLCIICLRADFTSVEKLTSEIGDTAIPKLASDAEATYFVIIKRACTFVNNLASEYYISDADVTDVQ